MSSYSRIQLEGFLKTLSIKAYTVFDIGGNQLPVSNRTKKWEVKDYQILDLPLWDLNNAWWGDKLKGRNLADVAFCLEVMEYVYDPVNAVKNLYDIIKPNGILYISFHYVYPLHPPVGDDMLRYTKNSVKKLLEDAGFTILEYVPRIIENKSDYIKWLDSEGYRYKAIELPDIFESGAIITATKKA